MKKLDGDLSARAGNFHQGLELSLSLYSRHPLDILNTGRNSVFLLKMFSVIFLLWKSESIFAASKISKPWPNQPQPTVNDICSAASSAVVLLQDTSRFNI